MSTILISHDLASEIIWHVFASMLIALQTRTDIRKQQLLQLMQNYVDEVIRNYLDTLEKTLEN